jgi:glutathione peroxidase-family protein
LSEEVKVYQDKAVLTYVVPAYNTTALEALAVVCSQFDENKIGRTEVTHLAAYNKYEVTVTLKSNSPEWFNESGEPVNFEVKGV